LARLLKVTRGIPGPTDGRKWPVRAGLPNEDGYPHQGYLDFAAINLTTTTGTLLMRGVLPNADGKILPGLYTRVRVPLEQRGAVISKFFIEHPIFANVMALVTVIVGGVFLYGLPVAQYPEIVPPTIQVSTRYPGASAEVVAATIGVPLEQAINGVENSIYMSSTSSSDGSYTLTITFDVGTDLDTSLA